MQKISEPNPRIPESPELFPGLLLLIAPIDLWRNSTPFFGAVAFCTTKTVDFRRRPQK